MPEVQVKNMRGEVVGTMQLDDRVFAVEPHRAVLHQAVVAQLANQRRGTADTKTRGEVAGGARKPWRQKGTGRARQGSIRAPHWRHGGVVFGPHPRDYHQDLPRKMRRLAMRSALSSKLAEGAVTVVDRFELPVPKTREMERALQALGAADGALVLLPARDEAVQRAAANLPRVRVVTPGGLNLLDVMNYNHLLLTADSIGPLTEQLTKGLKTVVSAES